MGRLCMEKIVTIEVLAEERDLREIPRTPGVTKGTVRHQPKCAVEGAVGSVIERRFEQRRVARRVRAVRGGGPDDGPPLRRTSGRSIRGAPADSTGPPPASALPLTLILVAEERLREDGT